MNKSQQLAVMILRAKIKTEETLKQHVQAWYGQEPKEVSNADKTEARKRTKS